jgi:uncharacterized protein
LFGRWRATYNPSDGASRKRSGGRLSFLSLIHPSHLKGNMTSASELLSLQEIDLNRDSRRAVIADIDSRLGETQAVAQAREADREAGEALEALRKKQREIDDELEDMDARIKSLEQKLYGGSIRNPKELSDLQKEVQHLRERRSKLDERALSNMDAIEAASASATRAREDAKQAEAAWRRDQEDLVASRTKAEREMAALESQRKERTEAMDRSAIGMYEALRPKKAGRPVARIERGTCLGCRVLLPTHVIQKVRAANTLVQCPSCERILVGG